MESTWAEPTCSMPRRPRRPRWPLTLTERLAASLALLSFCKSITQRPSKSNVRVSLDKGFIPESSHRFFWMCSRFLALTETCKELEQGGTKKEKRCRKWLEWTGAAAGFQSSRKIFKQTWNEAQGPVAKQVAWCILMYLDVACSAGNRKWTRLPALPCISMFGW